MAQKTLILCSLLLFYVNLSGQNRYNRYGFLLEQEGSEYKLKEEAEIRKQSSFDFNRIPCDMYYPYHNMGNFIHEDEYTKCKTVNYVFKKYPGYELKMEIDVPEGEGEFPFIMWIHGGGWHSGDLYGHKRFSTFLASNGIAGVRISYSLQSQGATFVDSWNDIQDALRFVEENAKTLRLDMQNFGFGGHSAGGHLATYAAMRIPGCKFLVSLNGIYDIKNVIPGFVPSKGHNSYFGETNKEKDFASPVNYVHPKAPFCLLTYSSGDYLIDKHQIRRLENELKRNKVQHKIIEKEYYSHAGFLGSDLYEPLMLTILNKAKELFSSKDTIRAVEARSAYDFVNSIGVNTHFGFYETNYWDKWDEITFPRLKELGVKHIRDGYGYRPLAEERFIQAGKMGMKLLLSAANDTPEQLRKKIDVLLPYLSGVEAINEGDLSLNPNPDPNIWVPYVKNKQQELFNLLKNTPEYNHLPVIGLSLGNIRDNADVLGDISEWVDYGNMHPYASGRHPLYHWGYGLTSNDIFYRTDILYGSKPIMATEAGYHNYEKEGISHLGVPEEVSAVYLPHLLFEYFNRGITRTYLYEFLDQHKRSDWANAPEIEWHFGMIRTNGEPKPSFYAIKHLISLLSEENKDFIPSPLKFELTSESHNQENNIRQTLLQKSDGSWWIAVYRTDEIYDPTTLTVKPLQPLQLNLRLGETANSIKIYTPNKSLESQHNFKKTDSIDFNLGAELVLIAVNL